MGVVGRFKDMWKNEENPRIYLFSIIYPNPSFPITLANFQVISI